jgi:hypothetical protein
MAVADSSSALPPLLSVANRWAVVQEHGWRPTFSSPGARSGFKLLPSGLRKLRRGSIFFFFKLICCLLPDGQPERIKMSTREG